LVLVKEGPLELEPKPVVIEEVVDIATLPEATYKFLVKGVETPAAEYVMLAGAWNAPPAVPVTKVSVVGYVLPLKLLM
jgi:hypothetical protein